MLWCYWDPICHFGWWNMAKQVRRNHRQLKTCSLAMYMAILFTTNMYQNAKCLARNQHHRMQSVLSIVMVAVLKSQWVLFVIKQSVALSDKSSMLGWNFTVWKCYNILGALIGLLNVTWSAEMSVDMLTARETLKYMSQLCSNHGVCWWHSIIRTPVPGQAYNSQKTSHILCCKASYEVSVMSYMKKNDPHNKPLM